MEAETYCTLFSHPRTPEILESAVTKHFSGLHTCNELLNIDDRQCISTELESAENFRVRETHATIPLDLFIPPLSSDDKTESVQDIKTDARDVSTHMDSTLQSSLSEHLPFRVDNELAGSEKRNIPTAGFDESGNSAKLELRELVYAKLPPDSEPNLSLTEHTIEDEDKTETVLTLSKKRKHTHSIDSTSSFPNPKRSTITFQRLQHRKLISPFRPPAFTSCSKVMDTKSSVPVPSLACVSTSAPGEQTLVSDLGSKLKHRTRRASTPFKSPLSADVATKLTAVRMTPTIQGLDRKVQLLRRAIKIKDDGEEETLLKLVKKWTEAGRDIAWEVWDLVKDNPSQDNKGRSSFGMQDSSFSTFKDTWYLDDQTNCQGKERNWGWDVEPERGAMDVFQKEILSTDEDDIRLQNTLGTMLTQLKILPETLGWNEEDGEFQDM
ncbi:hypothetical protein C0992_009492 [Termitomyces sp. T32_za158]|nr:hypothetical protein C0992_009492 [Termitomyces sp. T32_za158]